LNKNFIMSLISNWPAKVLSIVAAVLLFIVQDKNNMSTLRFDIPLEVKMNNNFVPTKVIQSKVHISSSVPQEKSAVINETNFQAKLDLSPYTEAGRYSVPVNITTLGIAQEIDLLETEAFPKEIIVVLDKKDGKYISISPEFKGKPAPGYELTDININPKEIYVEGPASTIKKLKSISTMPIDITGIDAAISRIVQVDDPNRTLTIATKNFQFNADVKAIETEKEFLDLQIAVKNLSGNFDFEFEEDIKGVLRIAGKENDLLLITEETLGSEALFIDCSSINKTGTYTLNINANMPETATLVSLEPEEIKITIKKR